MKVNVDTSPRQVSPSIDRSTSNHRTMARNETTSCSQCSDIVGVTPVDVACGPYAGVAIGVDAMAGGDTPIPSSGDTKMVDSSTMTEWKGKTYYISINIIYIHYILKQILSIYIHILLIS